MKRNPCPHYGKKKRECEDCRNAPGGLLEEKRTYARRISAERRAAGLCTQCGGGIDIDGRKICSSCAARLREMTKKKREGRRERGECIACGANERRGEESPYCLRCYWLNRQRDIRKKYGVYATAITDLYESQGGKCAVCKADVEWQVGYRTSKNAVSVACIDHCHESDAIRGILCNPCNRAIGYFRDDISVMQAAIQYLRAREPSANQPM